MRIPLPAVAMLYALGLVLGSVLPVQLPWLFGLSSAIGLLALAASKWRRPLLCLLVPLVGWTNLLTRSALLSPHDLRRVVGEQIEYVTVRGRLAATPVRRVHSRNERLSERSLVEINVTELRRKENWEPAVGRVSASTLGVLNPRFFSGQPIEATGVIQPPRGPAAPGQFDYRAYLQYRGVFYQLRCEDTNAWRLLAFAKPASALPLSDRFNHWAQATLAKGLPGQDESLQLLWAMVLGWKTALTDEVSEPFRQSGTLHIFAISGLHIALIAGILVSLSRVVRLPRRVAGLVIIPMLWFYTAATGWQASAVRSTIMMSVVLTGWALQRPSHLLNSLAAAALIILFWDPWQLFQASFQLSFFVVLGIALIVPPLDHLRQTLLHPDPLIPPELRPAWKRRLDLPLRWLATSMATSLAAWLGSMPLIACYFSMVTPCSLLANLLIVPLSSLALMSSLGSLICGSVLPLDLFNHSAWFWMLLMIRLSETFASLPGAFFHVPQPSAALFILYYLLLGGILSGIFFAPRWRLWAGLGAALLVAGCIFHWQSSRANVQITVLPGRAAPVYIDASGRRDDLLIDPGDSAAAEALTKPFLRSQGVNRLESLLLTHGDLAHAGGAELIVRDFRAGQILTNCTRFRSSVYRSLLTRLQASPARWGKVQRGDQIGPWTVLHPAEQDRFSQGADSALVIRGEFYGTRILLLSDLGRLGQRTLLEREPDLNADILIGAIPAQGEPLCDSLLQAARPQLVIIGCPEFSAPRASASLRNRLAEHQIPILYTSDSGAVILTLSPSGWGLKTMTGQRLSAPRNGMK